MKMEELEGAYALYLEGNIDFLPQAEEYVRLQRQTDKFLHSLEELTVLKEKWKAHKNMLLKKEKEEKTSLESLCTLQEEYKKVEREYEKDKKESLETIKSSYRQTEAGRNRR